MKLLTELVETPAVPGREHRLRELIRKRVKPLVDEVQVDALGSVIAIRKPRPKGGKKKGGASKSPQRVMLAAHMDQIGFLVKHVDDRGFVRINPVGGFDNRNLFARMVTVCPDLRDGSKDLPGVLNPAGKPVHLADPEDRKKVPEIEEFVIDLGLPGDEVKKRVQLGDMVVLRSSLTPMGNTVVSQCLDNRVACWIVLRALEQLKHHDCEVQAVFTVQEEVGLRGAGAAAFGLEPDIGIAVDTTLCVDTPGVPTEQRVTEQGAGAGLTVMDSASIADVDVFEAFERVAKQKKIKHQRSILPRGGTDAAAMQRVGKGLRTMTLSCPTRYIHTVTEMVHLDDLHACRDLLAAYLEQVG
ncbi:MAG: M20/M25/M40 family metallo-hydrolase [Phycisphaeraceae bacterium]